MKIRLFTVPNFVTLGNLAFGAVAIWTLMTDPSAAALRTAFWLMCAAAVCDFADGFIARLLKQSSPVGKQLDSLCDMVSFGVLPTMLTVRIYELTGGELWWCRVLIGLIVIGSALRLAKFNVDESQSEEFVGLPTPACALLVASLCYWCADHIYVTQSWMAWMVVAGAVLLSWLLIAPVRMIALKFHNRGFRGNEWRYSVVVIAVASVAVFGAVGIAVAIGGYVLLSLVKSVVECCSSRNLPTV